MSRVGLFHGVHPDDVDPLPKLTPLPQVAVVVGRDGPTYGQRVRLRHELRTFYERRRTRTLWHQGGPGGRDVVAVARDEGLDAVACPPAEFPRRLIGASFVIACPDLPDLPGAHVWGAVRLAQRAQKRLMVVDRNGDLALEAGFDPVPDERFRRAYRDWLS